MSDAKCTTGKIEFVAQADEGHADVDVRSGSECEVKVSFERVQVGRVGRGQGLLGCLVVVEGGEEREGSEIIRRMASAWATESWGCYGCSWGDTGRSHFRCRRGAEGFGFGREWLARGSADDVVGALWSS
jgi:hypothetical protein